MSRNSWKDPLLSDHGHGGSGRRIQTQIKLYNKSCLHVEAYAAGFYPKFPCPKLPVARSSFLKFPLSTSNFARVIDLPAIQPLSYYNNLVTITY